MSMSDEKLEAIISNEKEWRRELFKRVDHTRDELQSFKLDMTAAITSLNVKSKITSTIFGVIGGIAAATLSRFLLK